MLYFDNLTWKLLSWTPDLQHAPAVCPEALRDALSRSVDVGGVDKGGDRVELVPHAEVVGLAEGNRPRHGHEAVATIVNVVDQNVLDRCLCL